MPGSVYKRGEIYWIKFYYKGMMYRKSAETVHKREAEKTLAKYMGEVARGEFKGFRDDALSMKELFDDFEEECRRRKLRGIDRIVSHMKPLRAWFERMDVEQVTERTIDR